jgi:hypothetical protein
MAGAEVALNVEAVTLLDTCEPPFGGVVTKLPVITWLRRPTGTRAGTMAGDLGAKVGFSVVLRPNGRWPVELAA